MKHKKSLRLPQSYSGFSSAALSISASSDRGAIEQHTPEFVELLARSHFSFLQAASHPDEMVLTAKQLGYRGLALVDVNGLYGVVRGYQAAEKPSAFDTTQLSSKATAFHYIVGSELTLNNASPVALLPINRDGYARLSRLITKGKREAQKGSFDLSLETILSENQDLICFALPLVGGSPSPSASCSAPPLWNIEILKRLQDAFQDRLYLPVHKDLTWESVTLYQQALQIEDELEISLFATQRPLYHKPERKPLHDVLTCLYHKTTLNEAKTKLLLNSERHLRSPVDLARMWRDRPDLLRQTVAIAKRIEFSLSELRYRYPQEVLPPGKTATEYLRKLVEEGAKWRYPEGLPKRGRELIEHELKLIADLEYEDYFLTLWDICQFANSKGILHQGRGSAANSIVCFCLGLTNIDPVKINLLFERFISRERAEPPDIDIDFEHERREEVIQYIYKKYGAQHAAMVCTTICYRSRMAIREVSKVMGLELNQINRLIKYMGREGLKRLLNDPIEASQFGLSTQQFQMIVSLAREMQGFPRHLGIHTGGFIIGHDPIINIVPVEKASMQDRYVVQWNKDDVNILGLMKVDVLGLGMLTALKKSLEMLKNHKGIDWNLAQIPAEDRKTYEMIQKADTVGVFQIESRAQMSLLPRLKPATYYDLVIEVAIVRPGPIQGGMVHPFLRRRAGLEKVTYAHPKLESILGKTMGVPIFQEQIMQVVVAVAGFTPGEADELRRIMSSAWTRGSIMHTLRQRVINGMLSNGITLPYAEQIFRTIEGFSSYGFPESHAASFALLTYASCYIKCHHPEVFTCSLLNSQPLGFYSPRQLIADAQRHHVRFLPLDVQTSSWDYQLEKIDRQKPDDSSAWAIRVGFRAVHGLHEEPVRALVEERERNGPYRDLSDLIRRSKIARSELLRLAAAGALHSFSISSREALWAIQGLSFDEQSFFFAQPSTSETRTTEIPVETSWQEVQREYQTKGFSLTHHPLGILRSQINLRRPLFSTAKDLEKLRHGTSISVAGLISLMQKPPTAKGMCFLTLEDETGFFNVVVTPDVYERERMTIASNSLLEIHGKLENRQNVRHVRALQIRPLQADLQSLVSRKQSLSTQLKDPPTDQLTSNQLDQKKLNSVSN